MRMSDSVVLSLTRVETATSSELGESTSTSEFISTLRGLSEAEDESRTVVAWMRSGGRR